MHLEGDRHDEQRGKKKKKKPVPGRPCASSLPFSLLGTRSSFSDPRPIRGGHSRASGEPLGYGV